MLTYFVCLIAKNNGFYDNVYSKKIFFSEEEICLISFGKKMTPLLQHKNQLYVNKKEKKRIAELFLRENAYVLLINIIK